jgi:hypothetical protein
MNKKLIKLLFEKLYNKEVDDIFYSEEAQCYWISSNEEMYDVMINDEEIKIKKFDYKNDTYEDFDLIVF